MFCRTLTNRFAVYMLFRIEMMGVEGGIFSVICREERIGRVKVI